MCSASFVIRKMEIQTTKRSQSIPVGMAVWKKILAGWNTCRRWQMLGRQRKGSPRTLPAGM